MNSEVEKRATQWLKSPFDEKTRQEVARLMKEDPEALSDAFFQDLSFGTGGMRGIMGVGTNRMNSYTVQKATLALARYLKRQRAPDEKLSVFIGFDTRHESPEFAKTAAKTLAQEGIFVYLMDKPAPTPFISFGCRHLKTAAGIMITASHNPPEYNGFKVYWQGGGQVVSPHDTAILQEMEQIETLEPLLETGSIEIVSDSLDSLYLQEVEKLQLYSASPLKIVYTNLHGTGIRFVPKALQGRGFREILLVEKQTAEDGSFPFAKTPNPEDSKALQMGMELVEKESADLLLATDPDADRVAAAVLDQGKRVYLTGNQIACLCLHHILETLSLRGMLPSNGAVIKTIVTTELFRKIADAYQVTTVDVLTGFKYIAEKMNEWEASFGGYQFLFGAEESLGFLFGTYIREKDGVSSSCLIAEIAALAKKQNLTLVDRLHQIYRKYGLHLERVKSLPFEDSQEGVEKKERFLEKMRSEPPREILGKKVIRIDDYLSGQSTLPRSNVLTLWLEDETKLTIRPSGTEPKIKIYFEVVGDKTVPLKESLEKAEKKLEQLMRFYDAES